MGLSASVSTTIESSWETASTDTYSVAVTVTNQLVLPPRTTVRLMQLKGNYADTFTCNDNRYEIQEIPLDSGATRTQRVSISRKPMTKSLSSLPSEFDERLIQRCIDMLTPTKKY